MSAQPTVQSGAFPPPSSAYRVCQVYMTGVREMQGLEVMLLDGEPAQFAVLDRLGKPLDFGPNVARAMFELAIAWYDLSLKGAGYLPVVAQPLDWGPQASSPSNPEPEKGKRRRATRSQPDEPDLPPPRTDLGLTNCQIRFHIVDGLTFLTREGEPACLVVTDINGWIVARGTTEIARTVRSVVIEAYHRHLVEKGLMVEIAFYSIFGEEDLLREKRVRTSRTKQGPEYAPRAPGGELYSAWEYHGNR